jgi:hypothetical protein
MGEVLTDEERAVFTKLTGREREPLVRVSELTAIVGRRGGKTTAMAALATYIAACCDHTDALARGETGIVLAIAQDTKVAAKIISFCHAFLADSVILAQLIKSRTADVLELANNISVEARPASFRKLRGPTYVAVLADELAYFFTETNYANPDVEVLAAAKPGLLTTGGPLVMASSPYAKRGVLWDTFRRSYGPDGAPRGLVAKGSTRDFNETIPQEEIDRELARDRARNTAELLAEFRGDLESYVALEVVEACIGSYFELPPAASTRYSAFVDPSSGAADSFSLAISHREGDRIFIDLAYEKVPPFSPEAAIAELCDVLKRYRIHRVFGDRFGGQFPAEQFVKRGISYEAASKSKTDIYVDFLPMLSSGTVVLPRNDRLVHQLTSLERTVTRGSGRDVIDHPRAMHDDLANVVAGAATVARGKYRYDTSLDFVHGPDPVDADAAAAEAARRWQQSRYLNHIRVHSGYYFSRWR